MTRTTAKKSPRLPRIKRLTEQERITLSAFYDRAKACTTKEQVINLLKEFAEQKFGPPIAYRRDFKRLAHRFKIDKCLACGGKATDKHHVMSLHHGGKNHTHNIVGLCCDCHMGPMGVHSEMMGKFDRMPRASSVG